MPRLLATDLDGTFVGDDDATHALWAEIEDAGITLVFSTGRHLSSIEGLYEQLGTSRRADACVCMVGTEIWRLGTSGYLRDESWSRAIADRWDRGAVDTVVADVHGAERQPDEWQSEFKSSWFLHDAADRRIEEIRHRLEAQGLDAKVVYSAGRFLDILPVRSGKGEAVRHLAAGLGIPAGDVVTAGDTGNDLDMMRPELGFRGIAVGNAAPELTRYREPHVYHALAHHAAGIREGLVEYGWLRPEVVGT